MRWRLSTTCVLACLAGFAAPGRAQLLGDPWDGPVCRRPEVLDVVGRELLRRIAYARIDRDSVWEEPTLETDVVRCSLCLNVPLYDATHEQSPEPPACQVHAFDVQSLRAGFVVRSID